MQSLSSTRHSTILFGAGAEGKGQFNLPSGEGFKRDVVLANIVRELKKANVPVYFENEQLYSFDKEAELAISLHGAIAQGESENRISMYQSSYGT